MSTVERVSTSTAEVGRDEIRIYWMPGCSNCVRLKEYVTKRGFDFVNVNLQEDPDAADELRARGILGAPVITRGDRYAFGMDLAKVDQVLDVGDAEHARLPTDVLIARAPRFADAAVRFARQLPQARYWDDIPGRERSYLVLANHVIGHLNRLVTVAENPAESYDLLTYAGAGWQIPRPGDTEVFTGARSRDYTEDVLTPDVIAHKAGDLVQRMDEWWATGPDLGQSIDIFYGAQTMYDVVRSNVYSMAQHARQLQAVVTYLGFEPDGAIDQQDLHGLELPDALWDEG